MLYIDDNILNFDLEKMLGMVSEQRRQQAMKFSNELGRRQCVASYMLLKRALHEQFGINDEPIFDYEDGGKPILKNYPHIHFNISHCKKAVAVAVGLSPVGIDIEMIRPYKAVLAKHTLSSREMELVEQSDDKDVEFIKIWTRKEAYLKLTGKGIRCDLKTVDTDLMNISTYVENSGGYVYSVAYFD